MDFTIATFTMDDYDEVLALWQRSEGVGLSDADTRAGIRSYLARYSGIFESIGIMGNGKRC